METPGRLGSLYLRALEERGLRACSSLEGYMNSPKALVRSVRANSGTVIDVFEAPRVHSLKGSGEEGWNSAE